MTEKQIKNFNKNSIALVYISFLALVSVVYGLTIIPSPAQEHDRSLDHKRVVDLGELHTAIETQYQQNSALPQSLGEITATNDDPSSPLNKTDPQTNQPYEYKITSPTTYKLCATFATDSSKEDPATYDANNYNYATYKDQFKHLSGHYCFTETEEATGGVDYGNSPTIFPLQYPQSVKDNLASPVPTGSNSPSPEPTIYTPSGNAQ